MSKEQWIVFLIAVVAIMLYIYFRNKIQYGRKIEKKLENEWGQLPVRKFSREDFENISHYFRNMTNEQTVIDDITWNDLDMDSVFNMINNTYSSVGQEYLYKMLRVPKYENESLREFDALAGMFGTDENLRKSLQKEYIRLGYAKGISISDYMDAVSEIEITSSIPHYLSSLAILASVVAVAFNPPIGILCFTAAIGYAVISYYRYKAKVEPYFICVNHVIKLAVCAGQIGKAGRDNEVLKPYAEKLSDISKQFSGIVRDAVFIGTASGMDGSLASVIMDYIKIITHIDLIKFGKIVKSISDRKEDIRLLIENLGMLEASIAVASFREYLNGGNGFCCPELNSYSDGTHYIKAQDLYHPLKSKPVSNSIDENASVLLTGANASGKSTFLKTVAINAILAQTIFTCAAASYKANFFRIYSSMALKDDIRRGESYYMAEIKSLKRIIDAVEAENMKNVPVLCFVDEVLRGTNTVERIAASSQILYDIAGKNVMCFAATHDIELTEILEDAYANYHFQEEVLGNDVYFNYKLYKGKATSRNAIRLLSVMGYPQLIVDNAEKMAEEFTQNGMWEKVSPK